MDIRTASEKDSAGVPDLPSGGKLIEVQFADIGDRRVRGQLKDPSAIERKVGLPGCSFTCAGTLSTLLILFPGRYSGCDLHHSAHHVQAAALRSSVGCC